MRKEIKTENAPAAIGPYSQAVEAGGFLFVSGQIPINPADGSIPDGITAQTEQVLKNVSAILAADNLTLKDVIKTTVFLHHMDDRNDMNEVYAKFFPPPYPPRSTIEVSALPRDALVEIECVAITKRPRKKQ